MIALIACALFAVASAAPGYYGEVAAPIAYGHSYEPAVVKAPVYAAPVVKAVAPAATSYATFSQVHVTHPEPVVKYAAPVVAAPVVKYAAPVVSAPIVKYAAPVVSAPVVKYAAPVFKYAAPVVAAPVVKYAAPAYAAAPVYSQSFGGYSHGSSYGHGF